MNDFSSLSTSFQYPQQQHRRISDKQQQQQQRNQEVSEEISILFELLQGTSGSQFANERNGWDSKTPVCEWDGIECDFVGRLKVLHVVNGSLQGTIPTRLGLLSTLDEIYLTSNSLTGTIPSQVLQLPRMKILDLSRNQLHGSIPFPLPVSLEQLQLGHNQLSGTMEPSVFQDSKQNLRILKLLNIQHNQISGQLPPSYVSLSSIQTFDFSNNKFHGPIPDTLNDLATLQFLYLNNNHLTGTIPPQLGTPTLALEEIFIHGNSLTGTIPVALADLSHLKLLFLHNNRLSGTVPTELCSLKLNEIFYHDSPSTRSRNLQQQQATFVINTTTTTVKIESNQLPQHTLLERDGCNSIACPVGYKSVGNNRTDGIYPCQPCSEMEINPYLGSTTCFLMTQDAILNSLYEATNGREWTTQNTPWGSDDANSCDKEGITCNADQQVTSIVLENMGLSGSLPIGLGFLTRLTQLDLSHNQIEGSLPPDLHFAPLETLDVSNNRLTGSVPLTLCQKSGVNGNGLDGLYTCDTITCRAGTYASKGRADPGAYGEKCNVCPDNPSIFMGLTQCLELDEAEKKPKSLTPFGYTGEVSLAIFGFAILVIACFFRSRSKAMSRYILDRAYYEHGPGRDELLTHELQNSSNRTTSEVEETNDVPSSMENVGSIQLDVRIKDDWSESKEMKQKEVWLDVPRIT